MAPRDGGLFCSTNERDGLGDDLPSDYVTRVQDGGFYGWPWFFIGAHEDPCHRGERPDLAAKTIVPDVFFQAHSAPLTMNFYDPPVGAPAALGPAYSSQAFVAMHGSWNRAKRTGYKVVRVVMANDVPTGETGPEGRKCDNTAYARTEVDEAATSTERALVLASILDGDDPQSWFQLGNYYADQLRASNLPSADRGRAVELAIRNYRKSLALNKDDPFVLYHFARVVSDTDRGAVDKDTYESLAKEAGSSLCRAKLLAGPYADLSASIDRLAASAVPGVGGCPGRGDGRTALGGPAEPD